MKRLFLALMGLVLAMPLAAKATVAEEPKLGLPGPIVATEIQLQDLRVTYRFDQMNEPGKSVGYVPVQITAKLHNFGSAQTLDMAIPTVEVHNIKPQIASIYVNGQETGYSLQDDVSLKGYGERIDATVVRLSLAKDGEVIIDIRALQPLGQNKIPLLLSTAAGWNETIPSGTIEAITSFAPFNWNLELRHAKSNALAPLAYADNSAAHTFQNLIPSPAQDLYWQYADMEALEYFARGNERFQKTKGDSKSYQMMRRGLLDMIPCNGVKMPLKSWWNNTYEAVTLGYISEISEEQEKFAKALELWSDNWTVAQGAQEECTLMRQNPGQYKRFLSKLKAIEPAKRNTYANDALRNHKTFMRELSGEQGDGSIAKSETDELYLDENLSETDKSLLDNWDGDFINGDKNNATQSGDSVAARADEEKQSFVSSTINAVSNFFPKLSFGSQVLLFVFLAIILLVIIILIVTRWKEKPPKAPSSYPPQTQVKKTVAPSFIGDVKSKPEEKDFKPDYKNLASMRDVPAYPPVPEQPRKPESFAGAKTETKPQDIKQSASPEKPKTPDQDKNKSFKFTKPEPPKGPVLENKTDQKIPPHNQASDPPWIKKNGSQDLIKPSAPPPKPADNNFPWAKKPDQKNNNEQPPGPTVNI